MVRNFKRQLSCTLLCVFLAIIRSAADAQTVIACGGFVKGPDSIDFSRIEVRLFTVDGILKYQSYCAPHNGYFTVPVYNNGDYILKLLPPPGWSFNPPQVALKIDGKTDACSKQEDINFSFAGFQVSGKVLSIGTESGPEGLRVELQGENSAVKTVTTGPNGAYSFDGIDPGKYTLKAVHLSWRFQQNSLPIVVMKESVAAPSIYVTGYVLTASVMSDHNPAQGVTMTLYTPDKTDVKIPECRGDFSKSASISGFKAICEVLSDSSGLISFPPIPPGSYKLSPSYQNGRTRFTVVPTNYDVNIAHSSVNIKEPFLVTGFSVSGRLLFPSGYPAKDVVVLMNDKPVAKTGEDGVYVIEEMKSGALKLKFTAEHAEFQPLSSSVTSEATVLADIHASKIAACGQVVGDSGTETIEVVAKNSKTGTSQNVAVNSKKSRSFCFMLEPADYVFSVQNPVDIFRPRQLNVALKAGPQFGVSFEAFVASASGKVACLEKDCTGVLLTLFSKEQGSQLSAVAEMKTLKAGDFNFRNLHPGQYVLKATKAPYCFEPVEGLAFSINDKDVSGLEIKHNGFSLTVNSVHPIRLGFKLKDSKPEVSTGVEIQPPGQTSATVCLPKPGHYQVVHEKFSGRENDWGCHFFTGSYPSEIDTANLPRELNPVALLHLVTVGVQTNVEVSLEELYVGIRFIENKELENRVSGKSEQIDQPQIIEEEIAAYNKQKSKRQPIATPLKRRDRLYFGEDQFKKNSNGTFSYNSAIFWYATQIALEPKHPRLIFKPKMVEFNLDQNSIACPAFSAFFTGVEARVLKGSVTPATAGVRVQLTNKKNPDEVHVVWTEQDGTYSLGPLDPGDEFDAEASIEGWEIQPLAGKPGHFAAKRLGSIDVSVVDDAGKPLEGVLISISGPGHFRNNSMTAQEGSLRLHSLAGGQYYAQAFRKEYAFEPKNLLVPLNSGEASKIRFTGTRNAFSCFGQVISLNGEPESGVFVVARSTDCENAPGEEAETDTLGNFRILGLFPRCTYAITLRPIAQLERTVPRHAIVRVEDSDVRDVKMWAVRSPPPQLVVTARLDGPAELLNMFQISLINTATGVTLSSITPNSLLLAFPVLPAQQPGTPLSLKLEPLTNSVTAGYSFVAESVPLRIDESGFVHAVLEFDVKRRSEYGDLGSPIAALVQNRSLGSMIIAFLLIVGVGGSYFFATAEKNTKQAAFEGARSLIANPADFFKQRLAQTRSNSPSSKPEKPTPVLPRQQQKHQPSKAQNSATEIPVSDEPRKLKGERFTKVHRSSSASSVSSTDSSPTPPSDIPTEQPRKRGPQRSRLQ